MAPRDTSLGADASESAAPSTEKTLTRGDRTRIKFASFCGTLIETYDFSIYATAAALVFPKILFPALGPAAGTVASFATFGVAFVARPIGALLFGHLGDRLGRKKTLVTTLLGMGIATVLIGCIPTASQIGIAAPILVVLLRIVQGLCQGGEWAGATLFATEYAPKAKRGSWAIYPLLGGTVAFALANGTNLITSLGMSADAFLSWGWRIPFIASALLVVVGLYIRLKIDETPVFKGEARRSGIAKVPIAEAFKRQPREIMLASGVGLMQFSFFYVTGTYLTSYGTQVLQLSRTYVLTVGVIGGIVLSLAMAAAAVLSDRLGRRPLMLVANIVGAVWALVMFPILGLNSGLAFATVLCVTLVIVAANNGPLGAFLPELFQTRYRYTATGIAYNMGALVGGAVAPVIATPIAAAYGPFAFGVFLAVLSLIAAGCTWALRETRNTAMDRVEATPTEARTGAVAEA